MEGGGVVESDQIVLTVLVVTRETGAVRNWAPSPAAAAGSSCSNCSRLGNCGARPLSTPVILYNQSQLDTLSRQPGLGPSVMSLCNVFLFNVENDHNSNTLYCAVAEVRG